MQSNPRGTTEMRVLLIIGGVIVFGTPLFVLLAKLLGVENATIAVFALLLVVVFVIVRRYFERRRINRHSANQPFRSIGTTRYLPQKYSKHRQRSYIAAVNRPQKPEPTPLQRTRLKILRFALKPLQFVTHILSSSAEGEIKRDELSHRQTRHTMW